MKKKIAAALALMICFAAGTSTATAETADTEDHDVVKSVADRYEIIDSLGSKSFAKQEQDKSAIYISETVSGIETDGSYLCYKYLPDCYVKHSTAVIRDEEMCRKLREWSENIDLDRPTDDYGWLPERETTITFYGDDGKKMTITGDAGVLDEVEANSVYLYSDDAAVPALVIADFNNYIDELDLQLAAERPLGDTDLSGAVDVSDISVTAAYSKGLRAMCLPSLSRADVNADGAVNVTDLSKLAAHVKGVKSLG